jgi:CRISPR/Cas system CSM-associated protein Csm2 small subunit
MYRGSVAKCEFGCGKVWDWDREKREREAEDRRKEVQAEYRKQLIVLGDESLSLFESAPKHLSAAEEQLDQAEIDFGDRAFAPFWDCVENAVKGLGRADEVVRDINDRVSRYTDLARRCDSAPPAFPLAGASVAKLGVGTATAERLKSIVRIAQRDFQFATIYEQRRTNQILVAGFTNLAHALDRMSWQIGTSIQHLTTSVEVMTSTLDESIRRIESGMDDIPEALRLDARKRIGREKEALRMLDNIQRGRRPLL